MGGICAFNAPAVPPNQSTNCDVAIKSSSSSLFAHNTQPSLSDNELLRHTDKLTECAYVCPYVLCVPYRQTKSICWSPPPIEWSPSHISRRKVYAKDLRLFKRRNDHYLCASSCGFQITLNQFARTQ